MSNVARWSALLISGALFAVPANAALPSLEVSGGLYVLSVPYLEYSANGSIFAFSASLSGSRITSYRLSQASSVALDKSAAAATTPVLTESAGTFTLTLPYLEFLNGGTRSGYAAALVSKDLATFAVDAASVKAISSNPDAPTNVSVAATDGKTAGTQSFSSSTKLAVSWSAPGYAVDHYEISAVESIKNTTVTTASASSPVTLGGLKAATAYQVTVKACKDSACQSAASAAAVSAATSPEYWQLQGTGNGYANATRAVKDGSVLSWVMHWGTEAGSLAGRHEYFYKTVAAGRDGVAIATTAGTATDVATLTSFVTDTALGLRNPCTPPAYTDCASNSGALEINALQAIPVAAGKTVRLYMEATSLKETGSPTRIYSLDSKDGLTGQRYSSNAAKTYCGGSGSTDYAPGGACALTTVIGLSGDSVKPSPLKQARQFKIGYPTLDSWLWNGAAGTYMIVTGDDACGKYSNALFYAVYDGTDWTVQSDGSGCAKALVAKAHGPVLVHLGAAQYKLYYEDQSGGMSGKPLRLLYGNGAASGKVDFDAWESSASAREVYFLWPDGTLLDAQDESGLGDHMIVSDSNLASQFMFHNLGGFDNAKSPSGSLGLGISKLLNP